MKKDDRIIDEKFTWLLLIIGYFILANLYELIEFKPLPIDFALKGIGGVIGIYLLFIRFKTTDDMKKNQEEQFHLTNQYGHFLETSKLLTDKDSTIEAKISAMYLLYDYAKNHPQEIEKVYQLLSEYIKPLLSCINDNCQTKKSKRIEDSLEVEKNSKKRIFKIKEQKNLNLIFNDKDTRVIEKIYSWNNEGTDTERTIATALIILRDLTSDILPKVDKHIELSNIIILNLNIDFIKSENNIRFKSKVKPTYNLIFLGCNLKGIDFSKSKFHECKFINCKLQESNFNKCDLYKTQFIECNLKDATFKDVCIENIIFKDSINEPSN